MVENRNESGRVATSMPSLSLQSRMALLTLALTALATIAGVAGAGWWAHERALRAGEEALKQSVLMLDRSVDRSLADLRDAAIEIRQTYRQNQTPSANNVHLAMRTESLDAVTRVDIVARDGTVMASSMPQQVGTRWNDGQDETAAWAAGDETALSMTAEGRLAFDVAGDIVVRMVLDPAFFTSALTEVTTWKNQDADLLAGDGTPITGPATEWHAQVNATGPDARFGARGIVFAPPPTTIRSSDWLISHRWLPDLGVRVATAVPNNAVLVGWTTDFLVAVGLGGMILLIIGILTVITLRTERRGAQTKEKLREMSERLNLAFEGSNDGVWDWHTLEDKAYYSPRWCALLGYDQPDIAPRPQSWMDLLHPEDRAEVCGAMDDHLNGRSPVYTAVHRMRKKNGDWLWVESRGKALIATDGRAYRMVGTMTDIEEKKKQEMAVLAARDEAEAANRSKSEFLAVMSHEIRTPMSGVLGMAQVLLNSALTTKQRRYAELIRTSGESLLAILNDILDFSKLEAGHLALEEIDFCLNDEVDAVLRLMGPQARNKGIALECDDRSGGRVFLRGDPTRVRQILINLIGNAIKFTEEGAVTLRYRVNTTDGESRVALEVIDTGIGMSEEQRRRLFQKFSQGDPSIARRYGGTGLGLAICHQLTELMNGTIKIESQPSVGSRFLVNLALKPAASISPAATARLHPANHPDLAHLRVLAAEDNAVNQILLRELLSPHVATLDIVEDGESAIEAARRTGYDAVLMDVRLPGVDGVTATQEIRRLSAAWAERPIIGLTANAMSEQQAAYVEAGMTACLSKPIDFERLCSLLAEIGRGKAGAGATTTEPRQTTARPATEDGNEAMTHQEDVAKNAPAEAPKTAPAEAPKTDAHPLLDAQGLQQLVSIIGDESVGGLLEQLKLQLTDSMAQIAESRDTPTAISALAHTLAGAAGNCQAVLVSKVARALEAAVSNGADPSAEIEALSRAVTRTSDAIDAYLETLSADDAPAPSRMFAAE